MSLLSFEGIAITRAWTYKEGLDTRRLQVVAYHVPNTAFLSVSLIRVCQPLPLLRKWAAKSASSLMDMSSLVGALCLPRARRDHSTSSGSNSSAGRACSQSSSVHSGESGSRVICRCISTSSSSVGMCISRSYIITILYIQLAGLGTVGQRHPQ